MTDNKNIHIRPLTPADYDQWRVLAVGYRQFYHAPFDDASIDILWGWIMDKNHVLEGYCVEVAGKLAALCHIRAIPEPLLSQYVGFWDDLYVAPEFRGMKIADRVIEFVKQMAVARDWAIVYWLTAENNYTARRIYDKFAKKSQYILYEMAK